ncbi:GtrA family protein [Spongisporangium articulatum]|uniref:GtrA family protein n=1 Tax=Spongisporangium articulatum TaxID=3362603 RepID=A0ABW8AJW7_9ACTN
MVSTARHRVSAPLVGQIVRFGAIGVASTVAYALLYLGLRRLLDPFSANALALLVTAVANTAANRRLTFGVRGSDGLATDHTVGLLAFGTGLALTSGSLALLHLVTDPGAGVELVVLSVANVVATVVRFVALRFRLHRPRPGRGEAGSGLGSGHRQQAPQVVGGRAVQDAPGQLPQPGARPVALADLDLDPAAPAAQVGRVDGGDVDPGAAPVGVRFLADGGHQRLETLLGDGGR